MKIPDKLNLICGIYRIVHRASGKCYVGASKVIGKRLKKHFSAARTGSKATLLYNDIRIFGEDAFDFEILESCEKSGLSARELFYIDHFSAIKNGYNKSRMTNGAHDFSDLHRYKISLANKGRGICEESRKKISRALSGEKWSAERRKNIMLGILASGRKIRVDWFCDGCKKTHGGRTSPQKMPDGKLYCLHRFAKLNGIVRKVKNPRCGEENPAARLTAEKVLEIKRKYKPIHGVITALAKQYGVERTTVSLIVNGRTWRSIKP